MTGRGYLWAHTKALEGVWIELTLKSRQDRHSKPWRAVCSGRFLHRAGKWKVRLKTGEIPGLQKVVFPFHNDLK